MTWKYTYLLKDIYTIKHKQNCPSVSLAPSMICKQKNMKDLAPIDLENIALFILLVLYVGFKYCLRVWNIS